MLSRNQQGRGERTLESWPLTFTWCIMGKNTQQWEPATAADVGALSEDPSGNTKQRCPKGGSNQILLGGFHDLLVRLKISPQNLPYYPMHMVASVRARVRGGWGTSTVQLYFLSPVHSVSHYVDQAGLDLRAALLCQLPR